MSESEQRPYIGGQAVIEGVMMRSPRSFSIVVRRKSGELVVRERPVSRKAAPGGPWQWPFVRGVASLVEAIKLGSEALRFSSEIYERDHFGAPQAPIGAAGSALRVVGGALRALAYTVVGLATGEPEPGGNGPSAEGGPPGDGARRFFSVLTIGFAIVLFVVLPQTAAELGNRVAGVNLDLRSPFFQLETGAFKLLIIVSYLLLIRRVPEIRRVFQYHGAEHKTINALESGSELTPERVQKFSLIHPRCGTAFLLWVMVIGIFVFAFIGRPVWYWLIASRILLLPVIAGLAYELIRYAGKHQENRVLMTLLAPGLWLQRLTTREPTLDQVEVSIRAIQEVQRRESGETAAEHAEDRKVEVMA
jgi:uncharacterized protein YqhQ